MKLLSLLILGSIATNVGLVGYLAFSGLKERETPVSSKTQSPQALPVSRSTPQVSDDGRTDSLWSQLHPDDLRQLKDRLTQAGFPPKLVVAMIKRAIYEKFAARYRAVEPKLAWYYETAHFQNLGVYQTAYIGVSSLKAKQELLQIYKERVVLLTELLGHDSVLEANFDDEDRFRHGFLPAEKAQAVMMVERDYNAIVDPYDSFSNLSKGQQQLLRAEQRKDLEALLTPQELYEYDMRMSSLSTMMEYQLRTFQPTEAEFRALYSIFRDGMGPEANDGQATVDFGKLRSSQQTQIESLLGPERFAEFQQATTPDASKLNQITRRLGLPLSAATQVMTTQKEITQKGVDVQNDATLSSAQKTAMLAALPDEAAAKITATLGPSGFATYKEYNGTWIDKLKAGAGSK